MFLLFLSSADCYGFKNLTITNGETVKMDFSNKSAVMSIPKVRSGELIFTFFSERRNYTASSYQEPYLHMKDDVFTIKSNHQDPLTFYYWELPDNLCPAHNFVFDLEHKMHFNALVNQKAEVQCIFSPFAAKSVKMRMDYGQDAVELYNGSMKKQLVNEHSHSYPPFFIRLLPHELPYTFEFTASSKHTGVHYCHFNSIPLTLMPIAVPATFQGIINDIKCTNTHEEVLFYAKFSFGSSVFVFIISIIIFMHHFFWRRNETPEKSTNDTEYLINEEPAE
ncbi:hypothetical protein TVAG_431120 [Trichomonas vaginalis G3]|uniref:Uncharacterized protein n=1 Tax=Trichomonas vaginalis (strain ATCC PRA-98 / G3) TaxID=412133 RepID=A2EZF0_TRIV3|nr:hypothetical protein TVAGG3_0587820 [Trichomonas vaginalis G3]EAY01971.1 hypothetical protein TVAG_431120 [Trichomonas vaginalis G3]KAI5523023.1 hypothetical protein TVAGG3_0587820 [Trichomonas vaginalis G3]|eukprot:XP_001330812.1 hypothetical protein [Trichomonas vaginalis G3]